MGEGQAVGDASAVGVFGPKTIKTPDWVNLVLHRSSVVVRPHEFGTNLDRKPKPLPTIEEDHARILSIMRGDEESLSLAPDGQPLYGKSRTIDMTGRPFYEFPVRALMHFRDLRDHKGYPLIDAQDLHGSSTLIVSPPECCRYTHETLRHDWKHEYLVATDPHLTGFRMFAFITPMRPDVRAFQRSAISVLGDEHATARRVLMGIGHWFLTVAIDMPPA